MIVFLIADEDRHNLHTSITSDLSKALEFYRSMPSMHWPARKLNILVYLEDFENEKDAQERFQQVSSFTMEMKKKLVETINPEWLDIESTAYYVENYLHKKVK
jgi:putative endonuclease